MYQALYRKYRPKTFSEVVGQSHITDTLQRQVAESRVGHAYLFTGTRGTGKTSCARSLAKAVNCEHPVDGAPCCQCDSCRGIDAGTLLDVTELDAASNGSVNDARTLREEAVYPPSVLKKRVYIIDEVHMLSRDAFNALLKIMEAPPEHLLFILATTELQKVPATILSRCQRFSFKRILPRDMEQQLLKIAEAEHIDLTADGAEILARMANGALRDALSLLDQCRAVEGGIDSRAVLDTLGLAGGTQTLQMMRCLVARNAAEALASTLDMKDGKVLFNPAPMTELAAALAAGAAATAAASAVGTAAAVAGHRSVFADVFPLHIAQGVLHGHYAAVVIFIQHLYFGVGLQQPHRVAGQEVVVIEALVPQGVAGPGFVGGVGGQQAFFHKAVACLGVDDDVGLVIVFHHVYLASPGKPG